MARSNEPVFRWVNNFKCGSPRRDSQRGLNDCLPLRGGFAVRSNGEFGFPADHLACEVIRKLQLSRFGFLWIKVVIAAFAYLDMLAGTQQLSFITFMLVSTSQPANDQYAQSQLL